MKNLLLSLAFIVCNLTVYGQQLEAGFLIGYGANNIGDYTSDATLIVIGNELWDVTYGASALYYFKNPGEEATGRVGLILQHSTRGSVSEAYPNSRFKFAANTVGLFGGAAADVGDGFILYIDGGLGFTFMDNQPFYRGGRTQLEAFEDLDEELSIKDHQISFIFDMGVEKNLAKDILKIFLGVTGDAGISKVSEGSSSLRTQALWLSGGVRYIFPLKRKE